jgi:hypothetical protein
MPANRDVEGLYETPLAEFTRARNTVAARLKKAGHIAEAAAVKRLPKPTVPTWIVNQVARRDPANVQRLIKAVDQLKRAQLGDRGTLAQATDEQRAATRAMLDRAEDVAARSGLKLPPAAVVRVSATLLGAAVDPAERENLRRGRLTSERQAPGFDAFTAELPRLRLVASRSPARGEELPGRRRAVSRPSETAARASQGQPSRPSADVPSPRPAPSPPGKRARSSRSGSSRPTEPSPAPEPSPPNSEDVRHARAAARAARAEARARERRVASLERTAEQKRRAAARTRASVEKLSARLGTLEQRADAERRAAEDAANAARHSREAANEAAARPPATT